MMGSLKAWGLLWYWWKGWLSVIIWPELVNMEIVAAVPGQREAELVCTVSIHWLLIRPDDAQIVTARFDD